MAPRKTTNLSSADAAYIAIDGEGTVTLSREHRGERRRLVVSIANTDLSLLCFVMDASGVGKITSKRTAEPRHTASYTYRVTSRQALARLGQVARFLRTYKKARADLALADYLRLTARNRKYSSAIAVERLQFEMTFFAIGPKGSVSEPDACRHPSSSAPRAAQLLPGYALPQAS